MERTNRSPSPERTEPEPIRTGMITRSRRQSLPPSPVRIPFIEDAIEAQRIQNIRIQQDVCHLMHENNINSYSNRMKFKMILRS
jgi:hypothetical protein